MLTAQGREIGGSPTPTSYPSCRHLEDDGTDLQCRSYYGKPGRLSSLPGQPESPAHTMDLWVLGDTTKQLFFFKSTTSSTDEKAKPLSPKPTGAHCWAMASGHAPLQLLRGQCTEADSCRTSSLRERRNASRLWWPSRCSPHDGEGRLRQPAPKTWWLSAMFSVLKYSLRQHAVVSQSRKAMQSNRARGFLFVIRSKTRHHRP